MGSLTGGGGGKRFVMTSGIVLADCQGKCREYFLVWLAASSRSTYLYRE